MNFFCVPPILLAPPVKTSVFDFIKLNTFWNRTNCKTFYTFLQHPLKETTFQVHNMAV